MKDHGSGASRLAALVYGGLCYAAFLGVFLYLVLFTADWVVPKGVNDGTSRPFAEALLIDLGLLALFGIQHSVMARRRFKLWWTRIVPSVVERSTFVLASSVVLGALLVFWAPLPGTVWDVTGSAFEPVLWGLFVFGWLVLLVSTYLIDHFQLFGLRQVWMHFRGVSASEPEFKTPSLYRVVRHPMMLGILIGFWAIPRMTVSHLVLALGMTGYVLVGTVFEERDLLRSFGKRYAAYRERVPMLVPRPRLRERRNDGDTVGSET